MSGARVYRSLDPATSAQAQAAEPQASVWVSANAGSGKTRVLTQRVARLLLAGAQPSRILCLTYTKAAAAEMQNRLFRMLGDWAMAPDEKLAKDLDGVLAEHEPPLQPESRDAARRLFARALETPGGLRIQTIHAFCESLLSRFPLEAGVSPHFQVIDDVLAAELRGEALDRVVLAQAENPELAEAFAELVARQDETGLDDLIRDALGRHRSYDLSDDAELARWLGVEPGASRARLLADWRAGLDEERIREIADALISGASATGKKYGAQFKAALKAEDLDAAWSEFAAPLLKADGAARARVATKEVIAAQPWIEPAIDRLQMEAQQLRSRLLGAERYEASRALAIVACAALKEFRQLKADRAGLDYDDLIGKTVGLLTRSEAREWVRFKLDGGVEHILVDEAQDTSPEQWRAISAMAEEFFAGEGAREDLQREPETLRRTIFAVGDEKQSIYSFQGAAPALLSQIGRSFDERGEASGRPFRRSGLATSFRSAPAILSFVDHVFSPEDARKGLSFDGQPITHVAHRKTSPGRVELWPLIEPRESDPPPDWDAPLDAAPKDDPERRLAELLADTIAGWVGREKLPARGRMMRAGDVLVLVRSRGKLSNGLIKILKQKGVPVAGQDRLSLVAELAVRDLLALARFCLYPEDDLTLATLLRSPFCDVDEELLFDLAHGRSGRRRLWYALKERAADHPALAHAHGFLQQMVERADFLRPFELFAQALGPMGGRARLVARLGPEAEDPIDEFVGQTLSFETSGAPALQHFVEWLTARETEIKREHEQGRDEVRVMTAHGAKGLEAPVVILPDTTKSPSGGRAPALLDPGIAGVPPIRLGRKNHEPDAVAALRDATAAAEAEEHRRLLYVALTRAEDRLLICGAASRRGAAEGCWHQLCETAMQGLGRALPSPVLDAGGEPVEGYVYADDLPPAAPKEDRRAEAAAPEPDPDWLFAKPPVELAPSDIQPSHLLGEDPEPHGQPGFLPPERAKRRGVLIHLLLERLVEIEPAGRRGFGEALLAREAAEWRIEDRGQMLDEALGVLTAPELADLFEPGEGVAGLAEVPVSAVLPDLGPGEIHGVIDRLVVTPERVVIVDFKTGAIPDTPPEGYLRQLSVYRAALAKLYPDREVEAALVWTSGPARTRLDVTSLSAAYGRAAREVDRRRVDA